MPGSRLLANASWYYLSAYYNFDHEPSRNGEFNLLHRLSPYKFRTVFDVGANRGDWLSAALEALPGASFHAFEVAAPTFTRLHQRFGDRPGVTLNSFGLGETPGEVTVDYYPQDDTISMVAGSLLPAAAGSHECIVGRLETGDCYCAERGIGVIDFLKIDVEGAEMRVLRGFDGLLSRHAVSVVQFEATVYGRALVADFHSFFAARGYTVGKLFPHGVAFKAYDRHDELFRGPNFVAVAMDRTDLIDAVAVKAA